MKVVVEVSLVLVREVVLDDSVEVVMVERVVLDDSVVNVKVVVED